jgi:hypothetical protein
MFPYFSLKSLQKYHTCLKYDFRPSQHRGKKRSLSQKLKNAVERSDILPDKGKSHLSIFYLENKRMPIEYTRQIKREIWGIFFKI